VAQATAAHLQRHNTLQNTATHEHTASELTFENCAPVRIQTGGAGYNSPPKVSFPGLDSAVLKNVTGGISHIFQLATQFDGQQLKERAGC